LAEQERGSPRLDRDAANLRIALGAMQNSARDEALRFCVAMWPFWMRRIDLDEAQRRFDTALAATSERTPLRARALLRAAAIDFRSGELTRGRRLAEESLSDAAELGDAYAEWRALHLLGEFGLADDAATLAMPRYEQALALARREGFAPEQATPSASLAGSWAMRCAPRSSSPRAPSCWARSPARQS
jgi:hypothetical protein